MKIFKNIKISNIQYSIFFVLFLFIFLSVTKEVQAVTPEEQCGKDRSVCMKKLDEKATDLFQKQWVNMCDLELSECLSAIKGEEPSSIPTKGLKGASGRLGKIGTDIGATTKPLEEVIGGFIKGALVLVGTIFLVLMVYGGYIWMIARGDEQEAKKAKDIISMAVIGLAIVLVAYAVTYFVVYRLTQATL